MPGIVGIASQFETADLDLQLGDMLQSLRHREWYLEDRHIGQGLSLGRMTLGFTNRTKQPAHNEDRSLLAMMDGEIYDYEGKRRELLAAGHEFRGDSHAELLVHGY